MMMKHYTYPFLLIWLALLLLPATGSAQENFTLQLFHASDLEGGVEAIDNAPNFAAIIDALEETNENTLILSGGDNTIPGAFYGAAGDGSLRPVLQSVYQKLFGEPNLMNIREGDGRVDISIMNAIGFDASAVGNHEFDAGTNAYGGLIGTDIRGAGLGDVRWLGTQFPYLSANLDFSGDGNLAGLFTGELLSATTFASTPDDLDAAAAAPKIAPSTIIERGGERIGLVGATTQRLEQITSNGSVTVEGPTDDDMAALAAILQPEIDALLAEGINKIVLLTHLQQLANEKQLVGLLSGVDIVVAGGSDVLMAQPDDALRPGDAPAENYPFVTANADGEPAVVVGTPGEYTYVGRLVVEFDAAGVLDPVSFDNTDNGAYASLEMVVEEVWGGADAFAAGTKGELVRQLTDAVSAVVTVQDGNILGKTSVFLEGRREAVRTEETNLGNLTADANLAVARAYDPAVAVSMKNGGGIRAQIGQIVEVAPGEYEEQPPQANPDAGKEEGDISQLDVTNSLRFNNGLTLLTLTVEELLAVVEHGVADSAPGNTPGRFPQIGGMRFSYDTARPAGQRVGFIELIDEDGNGTQTLVTDGELVVDPQQPIRIVTLNFLADGGDGYPFPATDRVDLPEELSDPGVATFAEPGSEQDALAEYLLANFSETPFDEAETAPEEDFRIVPTTLPPLPCDAMAGTLTARSFSCLPGTSVFLRAREEEAPIVPEGFEVLYVLTQSEDLVIVNASDRPTFEVEEAALYTIHTLVYDPETLDLSIVEPGVTTGFDVNALLIQGGGTICGALDVAGAPFAVEECTPEECPADAAGLTPLQPDSRYANVQTVCFDDRTSVQLQARADGFPTKPLGFELLYVLTEGADLVIRQVNRLPVFTVDARGTYRIHTLVYDPETLDLSIVEPGVTTGFDVNALLIQGGGDICGALDVAGAEFDVTICGDCRADAGSLAPRYEPCFRDGSARLEAAVTHRPYVPYGFEKVFVLTAGEGLVIQAVNDKPIFNVRSGGIYTIHTLVYNPATLDLGIVEPGVTTGFDVNALLIQGGGGICGALDVRGARFDVGRGCGGYHLAVYPNPFRDRVTLEAPDQLTSPFTTIDVDSDVVVEVIGISGAVLYRRTIAGFAQREELDLSSLPAGLYTIRLIDEQGGAVETMRLTKGE